MRKFEFETCKNDKDVNCIHRTEDYPLCSHDFKPYDKGMERCCEIFKKCRVTGYYDDIIEERIHVDENCYKSFPKGHKKLFIPLGPYGVERHLQSWMYFTPFPEDELIRKLCYM
uniref:Uncharacterized protein n=1 Tax=Meloidogyne incognita TaxID=6306 RepID=A0A914KTZ8_MELIC